MYFFPELYNNISEILATEKLSSAARAALGSIKHKIHVHKTARAAHSAAPLPPIPSTEDATDLPGMIIKRMRHQSSLAY
jgi:hypothetical protein